MIDRPDLYVKCVVDLWEKGEARIKNLSIKPSEGCKKPKSLMRETSYINGVDWITLASLRDSENIIFSYDEESDKAAGITLESALKEWFLKVGATILYSNATYGLHIEKDELLKLVKHKQQCEEAHIVSLINAGLLNEGKMSLKFKNHWIVWNTAPQSNGKDIDLNTHQKEEIKQEVFSWGEIDRQLAKSVRKNLKFLTLTDYFSYNFGAMVFLPIPYELGECE